MQPDCRRVNTARFRSQNRHLNNTAPRRQGHKVNNTLDGDSSQAPALNSSRSIFFSYGAMASDPSSAGPSKSPAVVERPSTPPVNILSSPIARIYSIAHPALLLALGATHFEVLVANPTAGLFSSLPWLTLLQISYVIICLPPAGSVENAPAETKFNRSPGPTSRHGKHGKRKHHANSWSCIWSRLLVRS